MMPTRIITMASGSRPARGDRAKAARRLGLLNLLAALALATMGPGEGKASPEETGRALPQLRVEDRRIVDSNGSTALLRGVAVNQLGDYFQANAEVPATVPLLRGDFEEIAALGCNSVRLVVHWSRLEPKRGFRDPAYLAQIEEAVSWARESGLYVILDMHQDAWGKYIASDPGEACPWPLVPNIGWDGAPEWATFIDSKTRCKLIQREFSPAAFNAWQSFWEDREGIQQSLVETWAWLAAAFKDESAVAGYDLLNEPNWGNNAASVVLKQKPAFYQRATESIRAAESGGLRKIIFFEPLAIWSALPGEKPVRFTDDPDIVYSPHIYLGSISIDVYLFHRELIPLRSGFNLARREAEKFKTTFWNGEWMPGPGDHGFRYAALEDEFQVGSARWIWKTGCGDPHIMSGSWPDRTRKFEGKTHSVVIMRCGDPARPEGVPEGLNPLDAVILSRPYPRAFPAPATFTSDPRTRTLQMSGTAVDGNVPLTVWVPGPGEPTIESMGLTEIVLRRVPGGWLLHAMPGPGSWRLFAAGRE